MMKKIILGLILLSPLAHATTRTWSFSYGGTVQGNTAGFSMNLPAATAPTMCTQGGAIPIPALEWPITQSNYYAWTTFDIPTGYITNSAVSYSIEYRSTDSVHAAILTPSIACSGTSSPLDSPTFGAGSTINLTANSGRDQTITTGTWTPGSGSFPSCSAGQRMWIKLQVDTNTNGLTSGFDITNFTVNVQANN